MRTIPVRALYNLILFVTDVHVSAVSGVFAVCSAKENPWIAFPSEEKGTVMLFSPKTGEVFSVKVRLCLPAFAPL